MIALYTGRAVCSFLRVHWIADSKEVEDCRAGMDEQYK